MKVYRVENNKGNGPWTSGAVWNKEKHSVNPLPYEMFEPLCGNPGAIHDYICAMMEDQIMYWFSKNELKELSEIGYNLVCYEVDQREVVLGKAQVCILKDCEKQRLIIKEDIYVTISS